MAAVTGKDRPRVVAIDDEHLILEAWTEILSPAHDITCFSSPIAGLEHLSSVETDVVLLDLRMPEMDGMTVLEKVKRIASPPEVIIITGEGTVALAVEAMRAGAYDFLCKPIANYDEAIYRIAAASERRALRETNARLTRRLAAFGPSTELIGESPAIMAVKRFIAKVADSNAPVFITGESGTGKELAARAIHNASDRSKRVYLATNCGAITDTLIDSELFGHEKGAFTGASSQRRGLFEAADGGTLFLDEIGEIPLETQVRLLRVLQEGEIRRVGATSSRRVDVRTLAATNLDIDAAMADGRFREDLYYRMSTFRVSMPPLRDRRTDIPLLAQHLLDKTTERMDRGPSRFSDEALDILMSQDWPGNVRQLSNVVEHGATLCGGDEVGPEHLPVEMSTRRSRSPGARQAQSQGACDPAPNYQETRERHIREFEVRYLTTLMSAVEGNISEASRRSGIDRSNLRRMLKKHDLRTAFSKGT